MTAAIEAEAGQSPLASRAIKAGLVTLATGALLVIVGFPVLAIMLFAVFPQINELSFAAPFSTFVPTLARPDLIQATANSLALSLSVTALCALIAVPIAFLRSRLGRTAGRLWDAGLLMPFLIPPYIGSLAWMLLLQRGGYMQQIAGFNLHAELYSFPGIVTVMALHLFPLVYFATSRVFAMAGERYGDVAKVCGAPFAQAFLRIHVPLCLPALLSSGLLVFVLTIEEFGTPAILGTRFDFKVIVTAIHEKMSDWPIDLPGASTLSLLLIAIAFVAYRAHEAASRRTRAEIDVNASGAGGPPPSTAFSVVAHTVFLAVFAVAVALPLFSILATSFTATLSGGLTLDNLSWIHVLGLFEGDSDGVRAIVTSLSLAVMAALVTGVIGLLVAFILVRLRIRGAAFLDFLALLPNSVPGMAVAVGVILTWNQAFWPITPYNTVFILLIAYSCLMLPYPIRMVSAALKQIPRSLDDAAYISGASELGVIRRIILPIVAPSSVAAGFIVFAIATRELVSSLMLAPPGVETVSTYVFHQFDQGSVNDGMAMSLLAIAASALLIGVGQAMPGNGRS